MMWGSKGGNLISVKMIAKVIRIHAVLVLVLLFFSFIQIDFGHAVLYYILRFSLISRLFTLKLHALSIPLKWILNSQLDQKFHEVSFELFLLLLTPWRRLIIRIFEDLNNLAVVKSIYSEDATNFEKIIHIDLTFTQ